MPKDHWLAAKRKDIARRGRRMKSPFSKPPKPRKGRLWKIRKRRAHRKSRSAEESPIRVYTDFNSQPIHSVLRDYDPLVYGLPEGSTWPRTALGVQGQAKPEKAKRCEEWDLDAEYQAIVK